MPDYILNRNYLHRSTLGHTIRFEKGQPTFVPNECQREVVALGAERVDGDTPSPLGEEPQFEPTPVGSDREALVFAAFDEIVARNDSKEFSASGAPSVKAVEKLVKFEIDRKELVELWGAYRAAKEEAQ